MPAQNELIELDRRAYAHMHESRFQEAADDFMSLIRLQPDWDCGDPHYHLGRCLEELGCFAEAEKAFRAALQFRPEDPGFWGGLAGMYYTAGDFESAFKVHLELLWRYRKRDDSDGEEDSMKALKHLGSLLKLSDEEIRERVSEPSHSSFVPSS